MENISIIGKSCLGCRSCEQACPVKCISISENKEGFLYPSVDENTCIHCGKCVKSCPVKNADVHRNQPASVWALTNKNDQNIMNSASGGASDILVRSIINDDGVAYGVAYDRNFVVHHMEVASTDDARKIQSSKYVQSDTRNVYSEVKQRLAEGKKVLFTGTPCQVAGLYSFLGGDKDCLYTVDLICHGVPSPKFFKKYVEYMDRVMGEKMIYYNFRSKAKRGWGTQYLLKTKTKTKTKTLSLDRYGSHFMDSDCFRECCYECVYANTNRVGDVTIGDFWGIAKSHPECYTPKGVSSVFVNTDKGNELLSILQQNGRVEKATLQEGLVKQGNLVRPSGRPVCRDHFYDHIDDPDFIDNMKVGLKMKERVKTLLPAGVVNMIKSARIGGVINR
jgi:coenzyme F420-reducing hydrogenase beta subunit